MKLLLALLVADATVYGLSVPIVLWSIYLSVKHWNQEFMVIRGRKYKMCHLLLSASYSTYAMLTFIYMYLSDDGNTSDPDSVDPTNSWLLLMHFFMFVFAGMAALLQRLHVFSKIKITSDSADWKVALDPHFCTWTVRHWNKLKHPQLLVFFGTCATVIYVLPLFVTVVLIEGISFYNTVLVYLASRVFYASTFAFNNVVVFSKHLAPANDIWHIGPEARRIRYATVLMPANLFFLLSYVFQADWIYNTDNFVLVASQLFLGQVSVIFFCFITIINPVYSNVKAPYHVTLVQKIHRRSITGETATVTSLSPTVSKTTSLRSLGSTGISASVSDSNSKPSSPPAKKNLNPRATAEDVFSDSVSFDRFMSHLKTEFTLENGLFIVYLLQFQDLLLRHRVFDNLDIENKNCLLVSKGKLTLPNNVPVSPLFNLNVVKHLNLLHDRTKSKTRDSNVSALTPSKEPSAASAQEQSQPSEENIEQIFQTLHSQSVQSIKSAQVRLMVSDLLHLNEKLTLNVLNGFIVIYQLFIERDFAPFEVNISSVRRNIMMDHYDELLLLQLPRPGRRLESKKSRSVIVAGMSSITNVLKLGMGKSNEERKKALFSLADLDLLKNKIANSENETESKMQRLDFDFDFFQLWMDLIASSQEILPFINRSVRRYCKSQVARPSDSDRT